MAALSYYYSNCATPFEYLNSELSAIFTQPELQSQLMNENLDFSENNNFEPNDLFQFEEYYNSFNLLQVQQEYDEWHYPKRQIVGFDYQETVFSSALFHSPVSPTPQFPDFATGQPVYSYGSCDQSVKRQKVDKRSVSAQSISARQRRKRISEKTNELGKLIPGSQRMNTAEMLQAAYKYINYLQVQVGILEFMGSYEKEEKGKVFESEELNGLVESPLIQEKLYLNEKCLVPYNFVQELSNDEKFKCHLFEEMKVIGSS